MKRSTDGKTLERSNVFNLDIREQERGTKGMNSTDAEFWDSLII